MRPTLLVDFDGVIHSYTSGWQGAAKIADPPVPGAFTFLEKALQSFRVVVYSSRSGQEGGIEAMQAWFIQQGLHEGVEGAALAVTLEFPILKPPAFLTLDDRCVCFDGVFPSVMELLAFQPWYKRNEPA